MQRYARATCFLEPGVRHNCDASKCCKKWHLGILAPLNLIHPDPLLLHLAKGLIQFLFWRPSDWNAPTPCCCCYCCWLLVTVEIYRRPQGEEVSALHGYLRATLQPHAQHAQHALESADGIHIQDLLYAHLFGVQVNQACFVHRLNTYPSPALLSQSARFPRPAQQVHLQAAAPPAPPP